MEVPLPAVGHALNEHCLLRHQTGIQKVSLFVFTLVA